MGPLQFTIVALSGLPHWDKSFLIYDSLHVQLLLPLQACVSHDLFRAIDDCMVISSPVFTDG